MQAFDVELLRRQVLQAVQAGSGGYPAALLRPRYLAARYGPSEIAAQKPPAAWDCRGLLASMELDTPCLLYSSTRSLRFWSA